MGGVSDVLPVKLVEKGTSDDVLSNGIGRNPGNDSKESKETREEHFGKPVRRTC